MGSAPVSAPALPWSPALAAAIPWADAYTRCPGGCGGGAGAGAVQSGPLAVLDLEEVSLMTMAAS